jgi:CubicO group peptidase (beta-lactamase class C family)
LRNFLASTAFLFYCVALLARSEPQITADVGEQVDALVRTEMKRQHIPGMALGVYSDGKLVSARAYGLANVEWDVPVQPNTLFQSGSVGKQFVATAVMILVEGK